jgi:DNA-3-methyladenine glycosylase
MRSLRALPAPKADVEVANGPGKLTRAFDLRMEHYGTSILRGPISLRRAPRAAPALKVDTSRRIGLGQGADLPYRFYAADSRSVSRRRVP